MTRERERVVAEHSGLVRRIASRYRGFGLPEEDLVQEGLIGLLEAIDRYDPSRGPNFETFARFRVRRAIRNALTEQSRAVRLPKQVVERRRALAEAEARLAAAGRSATPEALAAATGLREDVVRALQSSSIAPVSIDPLEECIADRASLEPDEALLAKERATAVREAVEELPSTRRLVVTKHFGLEGDAEEIGEIASELHLSERRTRTIEHDALVELKEALVA